VRGAHLPRREGGRLAAVRLHDSARAAGLPEGAGAPGVGPALALGLLSSLTAERLVRAIREKDVATLQSVPRVGRKKAEQLILDLADKLDDLQSSGVPSGVGRGAAPGTDDAIRALVSLGYSMADAEKAVRGVLDGGAKGMSAPELIRAALARIGGR